MLPAFRQLIELYVAYRIFQAFCLALAIVALLAVPTWLLVDTLVAMVFVGVLLIPVAVVWAFFTLLRGLRDSRY
jgi:hypothetical protein